MSLEALTKQLGESRLMLAQLAPDTRGTNSGGSNQKKPETTSTPDEKEDEANFIVSENLLKKARMGIVEIIKSKKIFREGKTVMLNSPTSSDYSNPILSAVYLVLKKTANYFLLYEATKSAKTLTLNSFLNLLLKEKQLKTLFKKMSIFPKIFSKDNGATFIEFKHSIDKVDKRILIFKYSEDEKIETWLLNKKDRSESGTPTKRKASLSELISNFKLAMVPHSDDSHARLNDKTCIIKTKENWSPIPFDDLLASGKTLITPFETAIFSPDNFNDDFYKDKSNSKSDESDSNKNELTMKKSLKLGLGHIKRLSANIQDLSSLKKIGIFGHRKTISTPIVSECSPDCKPPI
ncbi:hypothetical protein AYI69_g4151 [Smittium culicis]|uniref:Uncharacterized protein n=1 Tax=Smittium culicis TaxID=133412 RepID=A0A1R1YG00_9FUNG|nr:hypothetical protein AYI69_g4170 [Smittium culicis]OMJ25855.1 hypothetical protein AYI69_g4151 [Smittium culicis]